MVDEYEENFRRFFRSHGDLRSLLNKIDDGKIVGSYFATRAVKDGMPGYILRVKLFVPEAPRVKLREGHLVKMEELWVVNGQARMLITTPPDYVSVESLSYDGKWLRARTAKGQQLSFFLGIPLLWRRMTFTYSNGVLQIVAPVHPLIHPPGASKPTPFTGGRNRNHWSIKG